MDSYQFIWQEKLYYPFMNLIYSGFSPGMKGFHNLSNSVLACRHHALLYPMRFYCIAGVRLMHCLTTPLRLVIYYRVTHCMQMRELPYHRLRLNAGMSKSVQRSSVLNHQLNLHLFGKVYTGIPKFRWFWRLFNNFNLLLSITWKFTKLMGVVQRINLRHI